jgi:hypothetical protein
MEGGVRLLSGRSSSHNLVLRGLRACRVLGTALALCTCLSMGLGAGLAYLSLLGLCKA